MTFALTANDDISEIVDALNYVLANTGGVLNIQNYILSVGQGGNLLIATNGNTVASFSPSGNVVIRGSLTQNGTPT